MQILAVLAASLAYLVSLFAAAAAFTCTEFNGLYSSSHQARDVLLHFQGKFCKEMPCEFELGVHKHAFGMCIGKDVMESAAESEAYKRASHVLKYE